MKYIEVNISTADSAQQEQLIALLGEEGFEGFEQLPGLLKAFILETDFKEDGFREVMAMFPDAGFTRSSLENRNWNEQWESSFQPVLVGNFAGIRASFHQPLPGVEHEIVITPKMSFGTGHHATTYLMIEQMAVLDFKGNYVIDFGTGTGVLAILAEMLGASSIDALDNDDWSIDNAKENFAANHCVLINLYKAESITSGRPADIVLANINLNVITANIKNIYDACKHGSDVLFSGLLIADKENISSIISLEGFDIIGYFEKDNWLAIKTKCKKN
jgi:ribosomal protein L11 methyltransferase